MVEAAAIVIIVILCVFGVLGCWYSFRRKGQRKLIKRQPGCYDTQIEYNLANEALPPMVGLLLRLASYLYTSRFGSWFVVPLALIRGKFTLMTQLVLEEQPTYQPLVQFDGPIADGSEVEVEDLIIKEQPTTNDNFVFVSISDFYHKYRDKELTPNDVAESVIKAIKDSEEQEPPLKALVQWDEDEIRKMAAASTKRFKKGHPLSVMDGVPVCIKEELSCTPYVFRVGTSYRSRKCTEDATVVSKLRAAGAMIIGMGNMHELGMGTTGNNISGHHKTARNPYNVDHYPGGSSSGPAVAVATGLCPVSIGTDGGGSVRIPAALCGLVGLKGTFGRFSGAGCAPLAFTVTHVGPLCGCVKDTAILYGMLAGPDPRDFNTKWQPPVTLDGFGKNDLEEIKLGIYQPYFEDADLEIIEACETAVKYLKKKGAKVVDIEIAELEEIRIAHITSILTEFTTGLKEDFAEHLRELSSEDALLLATASQFTGVGYVTANKQRTRSIDYLKNHVFNKVDAIITPATAVTAPKINPNELAYGFSKTSLTLNLMRYVSIGNLTGIPCLTVPVGYDHQGLPIGLQIMGRWWEDHIILRIGSVLENYMKNKLKKPQVYYEHLQ